jgi:hypothetical protein
MTREIQGAARSAACACVGTASAGGPLHADGQDCRRRLNQPLGTSKPTVLGCVAGKGTAAVPGRTAILLPTFVFAMSAHQAGDRL